MCCLFVLELVLTIDWQLMVLCHQGKHLCMFKSNPGFHDKTRIRSRYHFDPTQQICRIGSRLKSFSIIAKTGIYMDGIGLKSFWKRIQYSWKRSNYNTMPLLNFAGFNFFKSTWYTHKRKYLPRFHEDWIRFQNDFSPISSM